MKVTNKSKRLIVLNYKDDKEGFKTLSLGAGESAEVEALKESDVEFYVKKGSIEVEKVETKKTTTPPEPVVLPEEPTEENLKAMAVKDLRRYCKENNIEVPKGTKENGVVALILASLEPKE